VVFEIIVCASDDLTKGLEMVVAANVSLVERHDEDCDLSFLKRTAISGELNQRYIAVE
jgi:hypothetical protein